VEGNIQMAKIMVVEDEAVIRQLIIEELEKWQFEIGRASCRERV